jgi:hypothetical protein
VTQLARHSLSPAADAAIGDAPDPVDVAAGVLRLTALKPEHNWSMAAAGMLW